jgi:hypothetical protein
MVSDDVVAGGFRIAPLAPSARFYIAAPAGPEGTAFRLAAHRLDPAVGDVDGAELVAAARRVEDSSALDPQSAHALSPPVSR